MSRAYVQTSVCSLLNLNGIVRSQADLNSSPVISHFPPGGGLGMVCGDFTKHMSKECIFSDILVRSSEIL